MKYIFLLCCFIANTGFGQSDIIIKYFYKNPLVGCQKLNSDWVEKNEIVNGQKITYYDFSSHGIPIHFYPKQDNVNCAYLTLYGKVASFNGKNDNNLACDIDYGSIEIYKYSLKNKKYLALNGVRHGSGSASSYYYCNLFDITDTSNYTYYPLHSYFASGGSFGDYDNNGVIDFLQIERAPNDSSVNAFSLIFNSLDKQKNSFIEIKDKRIDFYKQNTDSGFSVIRRLY